MRNLTIRPKLRYSVAAFVLAGALALTPALPVRDARAWTIPPCEAYECPGGASAWWSVHGTMILAAMGFMEATMAFQITEIADRLTRIANANSQDSQAENTAGMSHVNAENTASLQNTLGRVRSNLGMTFAPATAGVFSSTCAIATNNVNIVNASVSARAQLRAAETQMSNTFGNAPATPGATGQIGYMSDRFRTRMQRYCNNTAGVVDLPAAAGACAASIGVDRDLFPYDSIFRVQNLNTANDYTAARDVVMNLMGNVVVDPVRGPALARQEGQSLSVQRHSEQARLNLAAGMLMALVERRRDASGAGQSELALNNNISFSSAATSALALANAAQNESQNLDTIAAMMGQNARQLYAFRGFLEQWAALKATSLAIDVKESSAGSTGVSSRILQRQ